MGKIAVTIEDQTYQVEVIPNPCVEGEFSVLVDGKPLSVAVPNLDGGSEPIEWVVIENRPYDVVLDPDLRWIKAGRTPRRIRVRDLEPAAPYPEGHVGPLTNGNGRIKAMIPGRVMRVLVQPGERVEAGQPLLVLEAMKMENEIRAPRAGNVRALHVKAGQDVLLNAMLVEIA